VQPKGSYSATCNGRPLADCAVRKIRRPRLQVKCGGLEFSIPKCYNLQTEHVRQ